MQLSSRAQGEDVGEPPSYKVLYIDITPSRAPSSRRTLLNVHPEVALVGEPCEAKRSQRETQPRRADHAHTATRNATVPHRPTCRQRSYRVACEVTRVREV